MKKHIKVNQHQGSRRHFVWITAFSLTFSIGFAAQANPTNGTVTAGQATISGENTNSMIIDQTSGRAAINWQSFNIGRGESVRIIQPTSDSTILNRVVGEKMSDIQGALKANGRVFLVNPNGIVFGNNAQVDVHSLIATTSNISDRDFMADQFIFDGNQAGTVINNGSINVAENGLVALVAPGVENNGVIRARLGRVALAAGNRFTVDLYGDGLVNLAIDNQLSDALVSNSGRIEADGGTVALSASAAKSVVDNVINMDGVITARSISQRDGKIILSGEGGGVTVSGEIDVDGEEGKIGGQIDILGKNITLTKNARLKANGEGGGGEIHIGGDLRGEGDRIRAEQTTVEQGAEISANGIGSSSGGLIVLWSDKETQANGNLSARGGIDGGDGGLIETSSAGQLSFTNSVDVSAPAGSGGMWLIDPEDITIGRAEADSIEATLNDGGSVSIETSESGSGEGNITVAASITKTEGDDAALALTAHNDVYVNAPITSTSGALKVKLTAGNAVKVNAQVTTNGGSFTSHISGRGAPESEALDQQDEIEQEDPDTHVAVEGNAEESADENNTSSQSVSSEILTGVTVNQNIHTEGGQVEIDAGDTGSVAVHAQIESSNLESGSVGGDITVTGNKVILAEGVLVNASGDSGGGKILIGGDYKGAGEIRNAQETRVESNVDIQSNAQTAGNAGQIVVWSDGTTDFEGTISANGGIESGDGGQIEVSGKKVLRYRGTVEASATNGEQGSLLLDPTTLTIVNTNAELDNNAAAPALSNSDQEVSQLSWEQIQNLGDIDLLIETTDDLTIAEMDGGEVTLPQSAETDAARAIAFRSNDGSIIFARRSDILKTSGGDLQFGAAEDLLLGVLETENPDSLTAGGTPKEYSQYIPGGSVLMIAGGDIRVDRVATYGGSLSASAGGDFYAGGSYSGGADSTAISESLPAIDLSAGVNSDLFEDDGLPITGVGVGAGGNVTLSGSLLIRAENISAIGGGDFGGGTDGFKAPIVDGTDPSIQPGTPPNILGETDYYGAPPPVVNYYTIGAVSTNFDLAYKGSINGVFSFPEYTNSLIEDPSVDARLRIRQLNSGNVPIAEVNLSAEQIRDLLVDLRTSVGPAANPLPFTGPNARGTGPGISKIFGSELLPALNNNFVFYRNPDVTNDNPITTAIGFNGQNLLAVATQGDSPTTSITPAIGLDGGDDLAPSPTATQNPVFIISGNSESNETQVAVSTQSSQSPSSESDRIIVESYTGKDSNESCGEGNYLSWIQFAVSSASDIAYMGKGDTIGSTADVFAEGNCL
ncbi:MAG: filamentous hemagglutinin N-terminal domain-containing protein [Acidiferrobacterales bacterium]|nr:filamentous hemagglutinin N-terminal domain-containing protein [Acidiferrobacterales bacterium]